jgi:hypothetical protein
MELLSLNQNLRPANSQDRSESNEGALDGFRLGQLEVYNWGTFNQQIWRLLLAAEQRC